MTVAIVTDSAAALPDDIALELDVTVVPMWLTVGGVSVAADSVDLNEMFAHEHVSTSGPAPGEFAAAIRERSNPDGICVLTIAATMSSTNEAARVGATAVDGHSGDAVRVVDTRTAAGAQALVVMAAARAARAGAALDDVVV